MKAKEFLERIISLKDNKIDKISLVTFDKVCGSKFGVVISKVLPNDCIDSCTGYIDHLNQYNTKYFVIQCKTEINTNNTKSIDMNDFVLYIQSMIKDSPDQEICLFENDYDMCDEKEITVTTEINYIVIKSNTLLIGEEEAIRFLMSI